MMTMTTMTSMTTMTPTPASASVYQFCPLASSPITRRVLLALALLFLAVLTSSSNSLWNGAQAKTVLRASNGSLATAQTTAAEIYGREDDGSRDSKPTIGSNLQHKVVFVTFGNKKFAKARNRIARDALETGWFDEVFPYKSRDLSQDFVEKYKEILALPRGGGYWIWKLDLIQNAWDEIDEGDFIVYSDAGNSIIKEASSVFFDWLRMIDESPYDLIGFSTPNGIEQKYCVDRIFDAMGVAPSNTEIRESKALWAGLQIIQKGNHARQWLKLVNQALEQDPWIITDKYNDETMAHRPDTFVENRHDQAIFSVSRKILGYVKVGFNHTPSTHCREDVPFCVTRSKS